MRHHWEEIRSRLRGSISIVLMDAPNNRLPDLLPLIPKVNEGLRTAAAGELIRVAL